MEKDPLPQSCRLGGRWLLLPAQEIWCWRRGPWPGVPEMGLAKHTEHMHFSPAGRSFVYSHFVRAETGPARFRSTAKASPDLICGCAGIHTEAFGLKNLLALDRAGLHES